MFSGSRGCPSPKGSSKGSLGARGSCANRRPPDLRAACRNSTSAAPTASFSSKPRSESPRGLSRYRSPSCNEMASSGMVSRSTKTPSPASRATTPIAELSITARRLPCRIEPPPAVPWYNTSCNALCAAGRSSRKSLRATNGYASITSR